MSDNTAAAAQVAAVLLADGWHHVARGSFSVGPLGLGAHADLGGLGFRFEEADAGSLHQPTSLAGPWTASSRYGRSPRPSSTSATWTGHAQRTTATGRLKARAGKFERASE